MQRNINDWLQLIATIRSFAEVSPTRNKRILKMRFIGLFLFALFAASFMMGVEAEPKIGVPFYKPISVRTKKF